MTRHGPVPVMCDHCGRRPHRVIVDMPPVPATPYRDAIPARRVGVCPTCFASRPYGGADMIRRGGRVVVDRRAPHTRRRGPGVPTDTGVMHGPLTVLDAWDAQHPTPATDSPDTGR